MLLAHPRANAWQPGPAAEFWEMLSQLALDQPQRHLLTRAAAAEKDADSYPPAKAQNPPTPAILFELRRILPAATLWSVSHQDLLLAEWTENPPA